MDQSAMPALLTEAGKGAERRFIEFFTARIRNKNTRAAYVNAIRQLRSGALGGD